MLKAVARLIGHLVAAGKKACSANTGAYCIARQNLPETFCRDVALHSGQELDRQARTPWLWKGRHVKIIDGTTVSAPDTEENQAEYPQDCHQQPGVGFPMLRVLVVFSLAVGTALEMAIGPCLGKGTSELAQFRQVRKVFKPGDIAVADRFHSAWFSLVLLREDDVDFVMRKNATRKTDFRRGRRLGKDDHVVLWSRPKRPDWMSVEMYQTLPQTLEVREVRLRVTQRGFRVKTIVVVTSLLDPTEYSLVDLTNLYRQRWHAELLFKRWKSQGLVAALTGSNDVHTMVSLWSRLIACVVQHWLLVAMTWGDARISLHKAAQTIREFALSIIASLNKPELVQLLTDITQIIIKTCARNKRKRPGTFEMLNDPGLLDFQLT